MLADLTYSEKELIRSARLGLWYTASALAPEDLVTCDEPDHQVRGEVIRELLLGWHGEVDPRGVRVANARITGELDVRYVTASVGLYLRECVVDQPALFNNARFPRLDMSGTHVPGLAATGLRVDGALHLRQGFTATGVGQRGAVNLVGASVGGSLSLSGARLTNDSGPALHAERITVDGTMRLRKGFTAIGSGIEGAVNLSIAHIGGVLMMREAQITNTSGPGLQAGQVRVDGSVKVRGGVVMTGHGHRGALHLVGARIGGSLSMEGTHLVNPDGPALHAERLRVDDRVILRAGFTATSGGTESSLIFKGAHVAGALEFADAHLDGAGEFLLNLDSAQCAYVVLPADLICPDSRDGCPGKARRIFVDGFTYTDVAGVGWQDWLHLLRFHTHTYLPQPYRQLAATRSAAGHDGDARRILITQQRDHRARGDVGGPMSRFAHFVWGALAGYGYRTSRTAVALVLVLLLAAGLGWWAGNTPTGPASFAAQRPTGGSCSTVELFGLGIDRGLPLASTGIRAKCDLDTASQAGQWFTIGIWLLQAALWALATLALAGYTGLVRKVR